VHDGCARLAFQKYCSAGSLIELDLDDLSLPLEEVSAYLCAKFDSRFTMSPRLFEMTVASVFAQFNWEAFLTGYSNDGGIDTILTNGPNRVGVQVKRYRGKIAARQIREFIGALGLAGIPRGFFVTTSDYQPGAYSAAKLLENMHFPVSSVTLFNGERFYEVLKLSQREAYQSKDEFVQSHDLSRLDLIHSFDGY
jgi:restriction system protein